MAWRVAGGKGVARGVGKAVRPTWGRASRLPERRDGGNRHCGSLKSAGTGRTQHGAGESWEGNAKSQAQFPPGTRPSPKRRPGLSLSRSPVSGQFVVPIPGPPRVFFGINSPLLFWSTNSLNCMVKRDDGRVFSTPCRSRWTHPKFLLRCGPTGHRHPVSWSRKQKCHVGAGRRSS